MRWSKKKRDAVRIGHFLTMKRSVYGFEAGKRYEVIGVDNDCSKQTFHLMGEDGWDLWAYNQWVEPPRYCKECRYDCKKISSCELFEAK